MRSEDLLDKLECLINGDSDALYGKKSISPSPRQIIAYEYERFLVAWVLLTRFPQEQLDVAWEVYGDKLSHFATCLLHNDVGTDAIDHDMLKNDDDNLFHTCYMRLVSQVTARLTTPPSKDLRRAIYNSWKKMSMITRARGVDEISSKLPNSTIIALNVDICNAFIAWMDIDSAFFSTDEVMNDIWNACVAVHTATKQTTPVEENTLAGIHSNSQNNERTAMLNVLESVLGRSSEAEKVDADRIVGDVYTTGNMQRLMLFIFELQGTKCASDEFVSNILRWRIQNNQGKMHNPELKILWDEWLMKNIVERIPRNKNNSTILRSPEMTDAIQQLALAHVVSPNVLALRPLAWQCVSQIIRTNGWSWIQKSSSQISICSWCQLACGEWKIQLEENGNLPSGRKIRLSILDGCGRVILSVLQHLVDFDERPDKAIPYTAESLSSIRRALQETLSLTSTYLNTTPCVIDDVESAIITNLWSTLFSEIDLSKSEDAKNTIACLRKLLLVSSDQSLVQALVYVLSICYTEDELPNEYADFNNAVREPTLVYMKRFWENIAQPNLLKKWYDHDIIESACVVTEVIAEKRPERIQELKNSVFAAVDFLAESVRAAPTKQRMKLRRSLQPARDLCATLLKHFGDKLATEENKSHLISSAIDLLEEK
jgi:hypothetical protein